MLLFAFFTLSFRIVLMDRSRVERVYTLLVLGSCGLLHEFHEVL
jgi:hypothetical protein